MKATEPQWARHYQEVWQERAGDDRLPMWLRVAALAYGNHLDNGHARFKRGEIGLVLGTVNAETGAVEAYTNVGRAIETAVAYGWLAPESFWGCLVVHGHAVKKGEHGHNPTCPIHQKRRRQGLETLTERRLRALPTTTSERFSPRIAHSVSGSEREPFSSLLLHAVPDHDREVTA